MARRGKKATSVQSPAKAESYRHPEADSPLRPDVGTQPQFKKKKAPVTYRYESSLSPSLDWDGQNSTRELVLIRKPLLFGSGWGEKNPDPCGIPRASE